MNITCSIDKLKNSVTLAEKMTGKSLSLPALHAILLIASGKTLKIRSTNLAVGIEIEIAAQVKEEGSVLVKGDILTNITNHLPSGNEVALTLTNDNLTLTTDSTVSVVKSMSNEEFPTLPIVEGETVSIDRSLLADGIRSVYFCAATSDIKPEIASVFLYTEDSTLNIVATDSFRLAEKKISIKGIPEISKILIPYKNVGDLLRVLDLHTGPIRLSFNRNQLSLSGNGVYFTTRLIDGAFPDYRLILPKEEVTRVVVMKQELLNTLRLSTIFADKFFQVSLLVEQGKKSVTIQSKNADIGSSVASVDAVIDGEPIDVSCNLKYFLDVFQALSGDSVSLSFTKPNKPILIRSVHDNSFLYLLMPANR